MAANAMKTILILAISVVAVLGTVSAAATHRVGEPGGAWDLTTDYGSWASANKFHPGDDLIFRYQPRVHNVLEVTKADYDSCNATSPIATFASGSTFISLPAVGTRYFICGFPGHCTTTGTGSMKLKVDVVPGSSPPSPARPTPSPSSAPAVSAGATPGFGLVLVLLAAGLMA